MCRRLCAAALGVLFALPALAQPPQNVLPQPRLSSVLPMGGKAGTPVELTVTGTDLEDPTGLLFSPCLSARHPVKSSAAQRS